MLIEVIDTSARRDRTIKTPHYARSGVPELWLVDLNQHTIEILHEPVADGYAKSERYSAGDEFSSTIIGSLSLRVAEILGL